jgi:hypothetical protein
VLSDAADLEARARRIAARKMGLRTDFYGENLPDDLWRQAIPEAQREAEIDKAFRHANRMMV